MSDTAPETAILGGGCFWCLEAVYQEVPGVESVVSGYSGGHVPDPTYRAVCSGTTGHAEVVRVTFDPERVSYRRLLEIFFTLHDPTTENRQGADVGTQYRSVVFFHDEAQRRTAREVMDELEREGVYDAPVVTQLLPAETFYEAEGYHQDYYRNHSAQPYCRAVIDPKVAKYRARFAS